MRRVYGFPRQDHEFKEFRGFPGIELGIFRVARSSGEGRRFHRAHIDPDTHRAEVQTFLSECPTALLVLLAAAARAGLVRLGLLRFRLAQRLGRVVAQDRLYSPNVLERVVMSAFRRQGVEPQGLLVVLGDA